MRTYENITERIGHTPLLQLNRYGKGLDAMLPAKLEGMPVDNHEHECCCPRIRERTDEKDKK